MDAFLGKKTKSSDSPRKTFKRKKYDTPYPETTVTAETYVHGDIRAKLLKNRIGKFIDFRRYFQDRPTPKGVRIPIKPFLICVNRLSTDMKKLVEDEEQN